jgi:cell division transport system permease protein
MWWTHTRRIIRAGFINFWRNKVVTIASLLVMTVTLFVIGTLLLGSAFFHASLADIEKRVDISVAFKPDAAEADVLSIKQSLEQLPSVTEVIYTSRENELINFRERHKDNSLLLQSLEEVGNPFGARLSIKSADPSQYESIASFLNNQDESSGGLIDKISFKKDLVDRLTALLASARQLGLIISVVLICMSILVTFNTISLAIYISREEISVMRLVGATNKYVRGPFLVEGVIAGILSCFMALILLYPTTMWLKGVTAGLYGGINLSSYYLQNFPKIFLILLASGVILGVVSSFLAVRKYLKD